ncbi:hypothetical protein WA026_020741 [Henosepilachna vigintioctopunctata]|uniref:Uncharacterized protein n=1 Tax=Henosepilachna vigintioctopunctata TaxID=420089 RepID=A0AAW1UFQ3_9CUCU
MTNGYWYIKDGNYWTNFSQCSEQNDTKVFFNDPKITNGSKLIQEYLPVLKIIKDTGYSISLVTLVIAILIMFAIR